MPSDNVVPPIKNVTMVNEVKERRSIMPAVIVVMLTAMIAGMVGALYVIVIPPENKELSTFLFGQVGGLWSASIMYWVGTTRGSSDKDRANKKQ